MQFDYLTIRSLLYRFDRLVFLLFMVVTIGAVAFYGYCLSFHILPNWPLSYKILGQAFLSGQTYLTIPPSPKLLALPNPYDPASHAHVRFLLDASLYNGRYYLYFGPVPALLPWIPVKWLTGISLSDLQLAFFFCATGTCYLVWLLAEIARRQPPILRWGMLFAVVAVCFGTWIPQMLHQPGIYVPAVAGAYCFMALGLLSLWYGSLYSTSQSAYWKLLGSLCFGLTIGCRMFYAFNAVILLAVWLAAMRNRHGWRTPIREALYLGTPWSLCIAGLAAYNYARFGSVFETGVRYQIGNDDLHSGVFHNYWQFSNIWPNFYEYFLKPCPLATWLPWQPNFRTMPEWDPILRRYTVQGWDAVHGLWCNNPFSLWSLWFLFNIRRCKSWLGGAYGLSVGLTLYTLAITTFLLLYHYLYNRYAVDFSPWIMLLATLGYMDALQTSSKRWHPVLLIAGGMMALWSAYTGIVSAAPWWM